MLIFYYSNRQLINSSLICHLQELFLSSSLISTHYSHYKFYCVQSESVLLTHFSRTSNSARELWGNNRWREDKLFWGDVSESHNDHAGISQCELHHVFMGKNKLMKVLVNVFILDKFTMSVLYARSCTGTKDLVLEQNKTQVWP